MSIRNDESEVSRPIACPRCGYDLRGIVSTWDDACPLKGRCSECGLQFDWRRVFRESVHPWLFEVRYPIRPIACYLSTALRSFNPIHFWRQIDLTDLIRPRLLVATLMIPLVLLWLVRLATAVESYEISRQSMKTWNPVGGTFSISGVFGHWFGNSWRWMGLVVPNMFLLFAAFLLWSVLTVAAFGMLPVTIRRARVRTLHLVRASGYTMLPFLALLIGMAFLDFGLTGWHYWRTGLSMTWLDFLELYAVPILIGMWFLFQIVGWTAACRLYLRLPNALLIALLLTIASGIATALVFLIPTNLSEDPWMWKYLH